MNLLMEVKESRKLTYPRIVSKLEKKDGHDSGKIL